MIVHVAAPASTAPSASLRDGLTATVDPGTATSKAARTRERGRCGRVPATCPIRARRPAVRTGSHGYSPSGRPPTPAAGQRKLAFEALQGGAHRQRATCSRIRSQDSTTAMRRRRTATRHTAGHRWHPPQVSEESVRPVPVSETGPGQLGTKRSQVQTLSPGRHDRPGQRLFLGSPGRASNPGCTARPRQ
jgi:hypothetical protein